MSREGDRGEVLPFEGLENDAGGIRSSPGVLAHAREGEARRL